MTSPKIFIIGTTHFAIPNFAIGPAVGLLCPPEPSRDYCGVGPRGHHGLP